MQPAKCAQQSDDIGSFDQRVIVIGQDTPRGTACTAPVDHVVEFEGKRIHSRRRGPDYRHVLVAGCRNVIEERISEVATWAMWGRMPGMPAASA